MDKKNFPVPVQRSVDELSVMADAGLYELVGYYRTYIGRGKSSGINTRQWEEELCYVQRELEIREVRAIVHNQWLEEQGPSDEEFWYE